MSAGYVTARQRIRAVRGRAAALSTFDRVVLLGVLLRQLERLPGGAHMMTVAQAAEDSLSAVERTSADGDEVTA